MERILSREMQSITWARLLAIGAKEPEAYRKIDLTGSEFTVALTREGDAFSFGTDDCTGHVWWGRGWSVSPDRRAALAPTKIKALHGLVVEELAAGSLHTIAHTKSGEIFTFGSGANGQLGHGDLQEQLLPKRVEAAELATESSAA